MQGVHDDEPCGDRLRCIDDPREGIRNENLAESMSARGLRQRESSKQHGWDLSWATFARSWSARLRGRPCGPRTRSSRLPRRLDRPRHKFERSGEWSRERLARAVMCPRTLRRRRSRTHRVALGRGARSERAPVSRGTVSRLRLAALVSAAFGLAGTSSASNISSKNPTGTVVVASYSLMMRSAFSSAAARANSLTGSCTSSAARSISDFRSGRTRNSRRADAAITP